MVEEVLDFARGETRLKIKPGALQDSLLQLQENNLEVLARADADLEGAITRGDLIEEDGEVAIHTRDRIRALLQRAKGE
mgnify:CR=1 FL=1